MEFLPLATFFVAFISSILSGIAGGGGGFIMAPYWLIAGLTPAQGAATGAFMALGMGSGSLVAFRGTDYLTKHNKLVKFLLVMTLLTSLVGPFFLRMVSVEVFKPILALITLASLPFLFIKIPRLEAARKHHIVSLVALVLLSLASSFITSSAFSILTSVILLQIFRTSVLEATAIRRVTGIIQSAVIFIVLVSLGNFVWQHALAGITGGTLGSYLGTKFALKKGERFAKYALAIGAIIGVVALF